MSDSITLLAMISTISRKVMHLLKTVSPSQMTSQPVLPHQNRVIDQQVQRLDHGAIYNTTDGTFWSHGNLPMVMTESGFNMLLHFATTRWLVRQYFQPLLTGGNVKNVVVELECLRDCADDVQAAVFIPFPTLPRPTVGSIIGHMPRVDIRRADMHRYRAASAP